MVKSKKRLKNGTGDTNTNPALFSADSAADVAALQCRRRNCTSAPLLLLPLLILLLHLLLLLLLLPLLLLLLILLLKTIRMAPPPPKFTIDFLGLASMSPVE